MGQHRVSPEGGLMMRALLKVLVAVTALALLASPALAQRGRGPRGGGGGGATQLLGNDGVQKELKLDKDQIAKVKDYNEKVTAKFKALEKEIADLTDDEKRDKRQEFGKKMTTEGDKFIKDLLNKDQTKRFKQLQLQARMQFAGPGIFTDPEVAKALKLSDTQKDDFKQLSEDLAKDIKELRDAAGMDMEKRREAFKKGAAMRKDAMDKAVKSLKDEQKKAWKEMIGDPFEFQFGRGRGRGRGQ
jgi:hypothetical protein